MMLHVPPAGRTHNAYGIPGDCWRTAIACLLGLETDEVPHFLMWDDEPDDPLAERFGHRWWRESRRFVRRHSLSLDLAAWPADVWTKWTNTDDPGIDPPTYVIATGPTVRGTNHCVIADARTLELVHDPRPGGDGLVEVDEVCAIIGPYDPALPDEEDAP